MFGAKMGRDDAATPKDLQLTTVPANAEMPVKRWFRRLQPVQLHIILTLTIVFFLTELIVSHVTHALTLLMDSYQTLCNILALYACMISVKYGKKGNPDTQTAGDDDKDEGLRALRETRQEHKLKNTFGWTRIDVIGMLICLVFLASLSFSILVEAVQTLVHIDHQDAMHHPIYVFSIGTAGLILNAVCYCCIGGYTFHQGSFLYVTDTGCVVLNRVVVTNESVRRGERRISRTKSINLPSLQGRRQRQGVKEILRDVVGCMFVMVTSLAVYYTDKEVAKYIDPIISILSASTLMILSYPYMKESCLILMQTIPDSINIDSLKTQLLEHFPDIINVHDLHVWELTANKVISTAHIIFQNPTIYLKITDKLTEFFQEYGVTQVTIQPEFYSKGKRVTDSNQSSNECLMFCSGEECKTSHCCPEIQPKALEFHHKWKSVSSEIAQTPSEEDTVEIKGIKVCSQEILNSTAEDNTEESSKNSAVENVPEEKEKETSRC